MVHRQVDRTERERAADDRRAVQLGDDRAPARRGRDLHAEIPALPRVVDRVRFAPFERLVGDLRLRGDVLAAVPAEVADELVGFAALGDLGRALHRPLPLRPGPAAQGLALHDIRRVVLLGVPAGGGPFAEVGGPATRVLGRGVGVLVELDDAGDGPIEEGAVMRDDHR